ncbi:MAG TPA: tautomerase family protein [Caulobacteraceae bacterium]|jgi:4-oxalocrotonate tautomerase|nr:tautomerase family protein [Caulobacteraceae bacterium]
MPEVVVYAVEGRSAAQKKALCADITAAVVKHFNAPVDAVTVIVIDNPRDSKMKGGVMFSER